MCFYISWGPIQQQGCNFKLENKHSHKCRKLRHQSLTMNCRALVRIALSFTEEMYFEVKSAYKTTLNQLRHYQDTWENFHDLLIPYEQVNLQSKVADSSYKYEGYMTEKLSDLIKKKLTRKRRNRSVLLMPSSLLLEQWFSHSCERDKGIQQQFNCSDSFMFWSTPPDQNQTRPSSLNFRLIIVFSSTYFSQCI